MPKDLSIKKVLVIGSGPIVIGQAAEFDYSGTQACNAFKAEGIEVVLINSNPATIMTDLGVAHYTYIEPLTLEFVEKIIVKEKPDCIIAGMGGQTGLNISCELYDLGILDKYGVRVIGSSIETIEQGEDRDKFKKLMDSINEPSVESGIVTNLDDGVNLARKIGYPVIIRPAYTLGGTGGGIAENEEEFREILTQGLHLSRVSQALIEKSIKGWKEIEFEVIRDGAGNCISVCSMENVDPVGVHTGDSIVVAPAQTLALKEFNMLRNAAIKIIDKIEIKGGCNVQFALNPNSFEYAVIEINPRVSRSSALASKATGYPIAKVNAKIAMGYTLDEIKNEVTGTTTACFEPVVDYVVLKIPKWPFDKFFGAKRKLGTKMMATGEVMAIGSSFEQALLKGVRSLEIGQYSLDLKSTRQLSIDELKKRVVAADDERLFHIAAMLRRDYRVENVCKTTGMDAFFIEKIKNIVDMEEKLRTLEISDLDFETLKRYKIMGFSDKGMADLMQVSPQEIYKKRVEFSLKPVYKMVDTCAGEYDAVSPYYYSTYDTENEANPSNGKKVMVIGAGPIRIGQGIEFDYCSVHSIYALKKAGIETIIVNNNPETVSTDFDTADKLYFEPLTEEDVLNIVETEKPDGVILQFGGQTAIKLSKFLREMDIPVYGTKPEQIDVAEDREKFDALLESLNVKRPKGRGVWNLADGISFAEEIGYPVLVRPSYVLGGQGMEITYDRQTLEKYLAGAFAKDSKNPVLIDRYLNGREIEVDAISDGTDVFIPGIMEHLERAGVHSGDSISVYPSQNLSDKIKEDIIEVTKKMAVALKVVGMINIQFIEYKSELYVIEVNPRSSRTVPYISKVTGIDIIDLATKAMLGTSLKQQGITEAIGKIPDVVTVKVPIFSTEKLPEVEVSLGPEMRSTGEVLGLGKTYAEALYKGFVAAKTTIPKSGDYILATISPIDQQGFIPVAKKLTEMGAKLMATQGTAEFLLKNGIEAAIVKKISEGVPNILDIIRSGFISLVINIPSKGNNVRSDGFKIRRVAAESGVTVITSLETANALSDIMVLGLAEKDLPVIALSEI
ncbi:MAG: carbamoyl-phosphate synthase large subunit [Clostridiales bacterium]|nr:carbamoyl-phosphate synthase large subunit [Clostridiales bacterium]